MTKQQDQLDRLIRAARSAADDPSCSIPHAGFHNCLDTVTNIHELATVLDDFAFDTISTLHLAFFELEDSEKQQDQDLAQHFSYLTTTAIADYLTAAGLDAYTIPIMKFFAPALTKLFLTFLTTNYTETELSNTMEEK